MSEIRVDTISEKTSGSGTTVSNLKNPNEPFRNLVINGDMQLFQRGTATTTVVNGSYQTADRFKFFESTDGAYTSEYDNLSVADQATTGQRAALELNVTTADGTIAAAQFAAVYHVLEGKNLQHLLYGTSAAKDFTLSFWVKSNKTGTYCVALDKQTNTAYRLPIEYTISSADTWEKKVITFSPTAGSTSLITASGAAISNSTVAGMTVTFGLAWGSDYQGTNNTWTTSQHYATSNQVNWMDSTSNNFYITGIQLEVGSGASDFEHLPFDVQFHRCARYCYLIASGNDQRLGNGALYQTDEMYFPVFLPNVLRGAGTLTGVGGSGYFLFYRSGFGDYFDEVTLWNTRDNMAHLRSIAGTISGTAGQAGMVTTANASASLIISAEL